MRLNTQRFSGNLNKNIENQLANEKKKCKKSIQKNKL